MSDLVLGVILGCVGGLISVFVLAVYITEIRPNIVKKRKLKKYNKLLYGTPKRIKMMYTDYDLFKNSTKPIWIDGEVYGRDFIFSVSRWHVNEEYVHIIRVSDGKRFTLRPERFPEYLSMALSCDRSFVRCKQFAVVEEVY